MLTRFGGGLSRVVVGSWPRLPSFFTYLAVGSPLALLGYGFGSLSWMFALAIA